MGRRGVDHDGARARVDKQQRELSVLREALSPVAVGHDRAVELGHDVVDGLALVRAIRNGDVVAARVTKKGAK